MTGPNGVTDEPKRPWWRRKRWWASGLLWLAVGYLASEGPARFALERGLLSRSTARAASLPADLTVGRTPLLADARAAYRGWWDDLAGRSRRSLSTFGGPGWEVVLTSDVEHEEDGAETRPGGDGVTFVVARCGGREIAVENARPRPGGGLVWGGPVTLGGRPVAELPAGTGRLFIEYYAGRLAVKADGAAVEVED